MLFDEIRRGGSYQRYCVDGNAPGCVSVFISSPLWVANTRLKLQGVTVKTKAEQQSASDRQLPMYSGIVGTHVSCSNHALFLTVPVQLFVKRH